MLHSGNPPGSGAIAQTDSRDWFKQLFELSPDPTWIIEGNRFVECNEAAVTTLCYPSRDELLNVHPSRLSPPRQADGEDSYLKAERMMTLAQANGLHRFEWIHTKANGTDFVAEVTLSATHLPGRQVIYCVWRDITERQQTEQALRDSESRLKDITFSMADWVWEVDEKCVYTYSSQKGFDYFGPRREDIIGKTPFDFMPPDEAKRVSAIFAEIAANKAPIKDLENWNIRADGQRVCLLTNGVPVLDATGNLKGYRGVDKDITERKGAELKLLQYQSLMSAVLENFPGAVSMIDADLRLIGYNSQFKQLLELPDSLFEKPDVSLADFIRYNAQRGEYGPGDIEQQVAASIERARKFQAHRFERVRPDGTVLEVRGAPLPNGGFVTVYLDITESKRMEMQVRELAFYDPLTQLPNRRLLGDRLSQTLAESKRSKRYGAMMFLDLDNFKALNDRHGHAVGDLLLVQAATRMKSCVREVDTVARLGGDEFVVVMGDLNESKTESSSQALSIANKIHSALAEPYALTAQHAGKADAIVEHHCTASIGVVVLIDGEGSQDDFLRWADSAMYRAKGAGRNLIQFHETDI